VHHLETAATGSQKKRKVLGKEPLTAREARNIIEVEKRKGKQQ
jgi:hypothetical protein